MNNNLKSIISCVLIMMIAFLAAFSMTGCDLQRESNTAVPEHEVIAPTETTGKPVKPSACAPQNPSEPADLTEPIHVHIHIEVLTMPSCIEGGYTTFTCDCGDTYTVDQTDALGHNYSNKVKDATCTEGGYTTYICDTCGDSYTIDLTDATGHNFKETVIAATCTQNGHVTHKCTLCGEEAVQDISALGHDYSEWVISQTASCIRDGKAERLCSHCGAKEIQDIAKTNHNWGNWVTVTEPTTEFCGSAKRVCTLCQKTEEKVIEKLTAPLYSPFDGVLNTYITENVPYFFFKTEEHWAAQITYCTTEKNDMIEIEIIAEFEKVFGYIPKAQVSVSTVGKFYIDGIDGVKVYAYKIWDNSVPLIDNDLMVVYDQICSDGVSHWTGFCFLGATLDDYENFANTEEFAKLSAEMYARFEQATGQTLSYMRQHRDQYALGWISIAGTCRTADGQILVSVKPIGGLW